MKIKTLLEYNRDNKKCKYCKGLGYDIFDHSKPCPRCSKDTVVIFKNFNDLKKTDINNDIQELVDEKIRLECWLEPNY